MVRSSFCAVFITLLRCVLPAPSARKVPFLRVHPHPRCGPCLYLCLHSIVRRKSGTSGVDPPSPHCVIGGSLLRAVGIPAGNGAILFWGWQRGSYIVGLRLVPPCLGPVAQNVFHHRTPVHVSTYLESCFVFCFDGHYNLVELLPRRWGVVWVGFLTAAVP